MAQIPQQRLDSVLKRFEMLEARMAAGPDADTYVKLASEYSDLQETAQKIRELTAARAEHDDLVFLRDDRNTDPEMRELANSELPALETLIEKLESQLQVLMLPRDSADTKNVILEIRAGTPREEALQNLATRTGVDDIQSFVAM